MPLQPLCFHSYQNVKQSLRRLKSAGLIDLERHGGHYRVKAKPELADQLLVAENGETYLSSDVMALSKEEAAEESIRFVTKHNGLRSVEHAQRSQQYLLHNRPLAETLNTLKINRAKYAVSIPEKSDILFPFPPIFPAITEKQKTVEHMKAEDFRDSCQSRQADDPFKVVVANKALEAVYCHASKTEKQQDDINLALYALDKSPQQMRYLHDRIEYHALLKKHPEIKAYSMQQLRQARKLHAKKQERLELAEGVAGLIFISALVTGIVMSISVTLTLPGLALLGVAALSGTAANRITKYRLSREASFNKKVTLIEQKLQFEEKAPQEAAFRQRIEARLQHEGKHKKPVLDANPPVPEVYRERKYNNNKRSRFSLFRFFKKLPFVQRNHPDNDCELRLLQQRIQVR